MLKKSIIIFLLIIFLIFLFGYIRLKTNTNDNMLNNDVTVEDNEDIIDDTEDDEIEVVELETGVYVGERKDGLKHGEGTYTWSNGDKYEGSFVEGKPVGEGVFRWNNGDTFIGEFLVDGSIINGKYTWANGDEYTGEFKEDELKVRIQKKELLYRVLYIISKIFR